jgi:hypothetical protein
MGQKGLGKTGEGYIQTWYKEQIYSRRKEFTSKYTDKGLAMEDDAIDLIAEHLQLGMIFKNETWYTNEFIHGTPDILLKDCVIDIKNSWDCFSFPLLHKECPDMDYFWQLQGYMELAGVQKAKLIYCLMDAPETIIEQEARRESWRMGYSELDMEIYNQTVEKMTYSHLPMELRIKVFEIAKCEDSIKKLKYRVEVCREYLKTIELKEWQSTN